MNNLTFIDRIERSSRISAVFAALGATVIFIALYLAYAEVRSLKVEALQLKAQNNELRRTAESMRREIGGLREALAASRDAIVAFHQRDYGRAVSFYDKALRADPKNAYLLNLKAYSLFKLKRLNDAITVQKDSLTIDPSYSWGYFDLARFQCAAGDFTEAKVSIEKALKDRPDLHAVMDQDGEFQRLCAPIREADRSGTEKGKK